MPKSLDAARLLAIARDTALAEAEAVQAVHLNNELWTILATDLADPGNALPEAMRAGLLSLAGFCLRHGHSALSGQASTDALIDINLSIMKGLRGEVAA